MLGLVVVGILLPQGEPERLRIDYARDVRPILSENCYQCHGPDQKARKADLRLDQRAGAFADLGGHAALVPGDPAASHLLRRLTTAVAKDHMPPAKTGKRLTAQQIETLREWIRQGAEWSRHWSLVAPIRPELPAVTPVSGRPWPRNGIDHFVLSKLRSRGLTPSTVAERRTLIRRVSFDLTGLPPTPEGLRVFLADTEPGSFERLVDRCLASPHYGERMAMVWLDAARYADTDGFQADATRSNWPWRDWVIDAYNRNLSFDRFTIEQFAGDLLPDPKPEQVLATCFHRNHMTNGEGGRDPEESRVDYVIDRVNTTGTVFLGMTLGCAQCHDHKYDPITQRDYYRLSAFFNSIDEDGSAGGGARPFLKYRSSRVRAGAEQSDRWLKSRRTELGQVQEKALEGFDRWLAQKIQNAGTSAHRSWTAVPAREMRSTHGTRVRQDAELNFDVVGPNPRHDDYILKMRPALARITGMRLQLLPRPGDPEGGWSLAADGHAILTNLKVSVVSRQRRQVRELEIRSAVADYQKKKKGDKNYGAVRDVLDDDPRTGWSTEGSDRTQRRTAVFAFAAPIVLAAEEELSIELRHRSLRGQSSIRRFRIEWTDELGPAVERVGPTPLERLAGVGNRVGDLDQAGRAVLHAQFLAGQPAVGAARAAERLAKRRSDRYRKAAAGVRVMVLGARKRPRATHVLVRGAFGKHGDRVRSGTPAVLGEGLVGAPKTRLGLARWLVDGRHPLTARVAVNRYWLMLFGAGLVRTPEDFGIQGDAPTHPALLDWLAVEFVESGWNVKQLLKRIVMSSTYRQSSRVSKALLELDPENRLLARASRFRMPAWMIRDAALAASGLLSPRLGGPPVYPYQPPGVWAASTMGRFHYQRSVGDDLYRRTVYTFWRRLVAPTAMFDASKRRSCQVRVVRTNTPLHALTLMNDTTFVEAARVLAGRILTCSALDSSAVDEKRIALAVEWILGRLPTAREARILAAQLRTIRSQYRSDRQGAEKLLNFGATPRRQGVDVVSHAAFTVLASTLFNLDEAITRE